MNKYAWFSKLYRGLGSVFLILSIVFFVRYALQHIDDMPSITWGLVQWSVVLASVLLHIGNIIVLGLIWQLLLYDHGVRLHSWQLQVVIFISQFGKYLPGNIGHFAGRAYMAKDLDIAVSTSVHTIIVESLLSVGVAGVLAFIALWFLIDTNIMTGIISVQPYVLVLLLIGSLLFPLVSVRCLNAFFPRISNKISGGGPIIEPRVRTAVAVAGLFLFCFFTIGLIIQMHSTWLFNAPGVHVIEFTVLFAVVWVAGYIVPGAPAGVGIREALMLVLFSPIVGPAIAVALSVSFRLVTTIGDGLAFLIGLLVRRSVSEKFRNLT